MGISTEGDWGTGAHATSASSFTFTSATTALTSNMVGLLIVVTDNVDTASGETNLHTSITGGTGQWVKVSEYTNGEGAAGAGVTTSLWMFRSSGSNPIGTVYTINLASAVVEKCCSGHVFSVDAGNSLRVPAGLTIQFSEVDAAVGFGSSTISGLTSKQYLWIRALGKEANSTGNISPSASFGTFGVARSQNAASAVLVRGERRVIIATTQTSNPTMATTGDTAGIFVAFEEFTPPAGASGDSAGTLGFTGSATGTVRDTRTNIALHSEDFLNAWWQRVGVSVNANVTTAPDATSTADRMVENTGTQQHGVRRLDFPMDAGKWYTASIYAKADVGTRTFRIRFPFNAFGQNTSGHFDLSTGEILGVQGNVWATTSNVGSGWFRFSVTAQATTTITTGGNLSFFLNNAGADSYAGDSTSSAFIWGAQIEEGENPSTYKPTTTDPISGPWWPKIVGTENDGTIGFTGSAAGLARAGGTLSGTLPFTSSATGRSLIRASSSGSLGFTLNALGTSRVVGTGSGSLALSGSATGLAPARGQVSQQLGFTISAQGLAPVRGQVVDGSLPFTGSSAGKALIQGQVSGSIDFSLASSNSQDVIGISGGILDFLVAAEGRALVSGTGTGSLGFSIEATATVVDGEVPDPELGEGAGSISFSLNATGMALAQGYLEGSFTFALSSQGRAFDPVIYKAAPVLGVWPRREVDGVFPDRETTAVWPKRERIATWV